mmetsp:Transcript_17820/g.57942  ORF Transcript_17820/g.57942 Transcript_17820/m.57942 type:complete len:520 (+) Transcript_17820:721-2280(+)
MPPADSARPARRRASGTHQCCFRVSSRTRGVASAGFANTASRSSLSPTPMARRGGLRRDGGATRPAAFSPLDVGCHCQPLDRRFVCRFRINILPPGCGTATFRTMGQAGSTDGGPMGAMEALQQQLDRLEQNLTSLEEDYAERVAGELLDGSKEPSGDLYLCGARLKCDGAVRVVTGPVVGLVGSTTARILLEVDADAEVAFAACLVDKNCPGGRETRRGAATLKANRPGVCELTGLTPDSRFVVVLGNVHRSDAVERLCEFCTYERAGKREEARARFIAVAHDRPTAVRPGEYNRWETIVERVSMRQLPPVNVMVHVGGQVEMRRFFEEAWVMLKRGVEQRSLAAALSGATEPWHELEKRACDRLRDGYRFAWNLPGKRDVLSHCPHLMLCGEGDVYPRFTDALELSPGVGGEVASTMLRLARRVFWEYQRQLWDPLPNCAAAAVSAAERHLDNGSLRDVGLDHPWGSTPGVPEGHATGCSSVSSHGEWFFETFCGGVVGLFALDTKREPASLSFASF